MQYQLLPNFKPLIYVNNDINHYDSMLSIIFKCNNLEVAEKILIEKKIDLEKNADILCDCVKNGTLEMFILLIKYGANITSKSQRADLSNKKYPVIWTMCNIGRLDTMMHIFKQKYDKNLMMVLIVKNYPILIQKWMIKYIMN